MRIKVTTCKHRPKTYPIVPMALLKGLDRLAASGVMVLSSAANSRELILRLESDMFHVCRCADKGVTFTTTFM